MISNGEAWQSVDCEICGALAFENCKPRLDPQGCSHCEAINARVLRGDSHCGGGNRELAERQHEATAGFEVAAAAAADFDSAAAIPDPSEAP